MAVFSTPSISFLTMEKPMKRTTLLILALTLIIAVPVAAYETRDIEPVPFTAVRLDDGFWTPRLQTTRMVTLPYNFKKCEDTGRISNFAMAGGLMEGECEGIYFNDSDVYKVLEAAAYALSAERDRALKKYVDDLIAKMAAAQQDDGYLNTFYTLTGLEKSWTNIEDKHELYCGGHMIEAAVAHFQATGERSLLDVAIRFADLVDSIFGPGKRSDVPGHEEIELALVKLFHATGEERYLALAQFFIDERGCTDRRKIYGDYCQDHLPVRQQAEIVGHAVRAMYLYCGMADVAAATRDKGYIATMERIWNDVVKRKMYITGGIGPSAHNEGFTVAYDLPNDTAYAETCAAIGMVLWNHRLNLLHADARYVDVLERALYNGMLSGVSLDGKRFFYTNPIESRGNHHRKEWFDCSCCPVNVVRFLSSLTGYVYAHGADTIHVNLFATGIATIPLSEGGVSLTQKTRYPWDGRIAIAVTPHADAGKQEFTLALRVPGWCWSARVTVNGEEWSEPDMFHKGYLSIRRSWQEGDEVLFDLHMPVRRVKAHPAVAANKGRTALMRGPLVYCLEGVDNNGRVRNLVLPPDAALTTEFRPDLLGGVTVLKGTALAAYPEEHDDRLYRPAARVVPKEFMAVPYYAWDNRAPGEMVVWLPESAEHVEMSPMEGVTPSASHCYGQDSLKALHDRIEPSASNDHGLRRFTWWDKKGSTEWVQYDFDEARRLSSVAVYWFEDSPHGGCRLPASWRLFYKEADSWKPVRNAAPFSVEPDQYNRVSFDPVKTKGLKIEVELRDGFSGGILEWAIGSDR